MPRALGEIAERLRRSTVQVRSARRPWPGRRRPGVIASPDGRIVTNAHVAREAAPPSSFGMAVSFRRPWWPATRAAIGNAQIEAAGLPAAPFGDSSALRVGELVMAIGNPMGFIGALTTGVVHALGTCPGFGRQSWVLADVRLAPGNSGGPLADAHGRVIGINTMIVNGLGAAVPGNAVTAFLHRGASGYLAGPDGAAGAIRKTGASACWCSGRARDSPAAAGAVVDRRSAHRRRRPAVPLH